MMKVKVKTKKRASRSRKVIFNMNKELSRIGDLELQVGVFKDSGSYDTGASVAMVAKINEYGLPSKNIPARSFLRSTLIENRAIYVKMLKHRRLKNSKNAIIVLEDLGDRVAYDIRKKVKDLRIPPLKQVRSDGSMNPLYHTKKLHDSIEPRIRKRRKR